jgi:hypothetical protein
MVHVFQNFSFLKSSKAAMHQIGKFMLQNYSDPASFSPVTLYFDPWGNCSQLGKKKSIADTKPKILARARL